jgi:hypothetical protein
VCLRARFAPVYETAERYGQRTISRMHGDFWWQGFAPRPAQDIVQDMHDSHKQLDEIKALTMHKMVDEYETPNGTKKLIFFTNYQVWQKKTWCLQLKNTRLHA